MNFRYATTPHGIVSCDDNMVMFIPTYNIVQLIAMLHSMKLLPLNANNQVAEEICSGLRGRIIS